MSCGQFCRLFFQAILVATLLPQTTFAFQSQSTTFSWVDATSHTPVTWRRNNCTGASATGDDTITAALPLGFSFNFQGTNFTSVRVMSNGRLQFNNTYCGYGTQATSPRTYPFNYPNGNLNRTIKVYGADLIPSGGGTVTYAQSGSAPNRTFIVTWSNVPEWGASGSSFNLQAIIKESGDFVLQYGASNNTSGGKAQIGWQNTTSDYGLYSFSSIGALANTAIRFYVPPPTVIAQYAFEQNAWSGAGAAIDDYSGNGNAGLTLGTSTLSVSGKVCKGVDIPHNSSPTIIDAVDTQVDVDTTLGNQGTIAFWYRSVDKWKDNVDRTLLDASKASTAKYFFVSKTRDGRVRFALEDSADRDFSYTTSKQNFAAGTWVHIAVTWDMPGDRLQIYINGTLATSATPNTNGVLGDMSSLHIGDNSSTSYNIAPNTSAKGRFDEVNLYQGVLSAGQITTDMNATHPCTGGLVAHYKLEESAWTGVAGEMKDSSGYGLDGKSVGSPVSANGKICLAATLDGSNYLEVADNPTLDIVDELTVSAWINPASIPSSGLKTIVSKDENFEFHLNAAGRIFWWWQNSSGGTHSFDSGSTTVSASQWTHVAIVYSRSNARQSIYINGVEAAFRTYSSEDLRNNADPLQIGADQGIGSRQFVGLIDEVRVYDTALTVTEIIALVNETNPCQAPQAIAQYAFEQGTWTGAGVAISDYTGNGNTGVTVGNPSSNAAGYVCMGADIPNNTSAAIIDAINSQQDVDTDLGNAGTISFWYRNAASWQGGGDRTLADASTRVLNNANDKYFYVSKRSNGAIRFGYEDSADRDFRIDTASYNFAIGTWVHILVTWDLPNDSQQIYVNGTLAASGNGNTNGTLGDVGNLYFGDNSSTYAAPGSSAYGRMDEIRLYKRVLSSAEVTAVMMASHPCGATIDHFTVSHDGSGINCLAENITLRAEDSGGALISGYSGTINLSTTTGHGSWAAVTATNAVVDATSDDGAASYTFDAADGGTVVLSLSDTHQESLNIGVSDGAVSDDGSDPNLIFRPFGFLVSPAPVGTQIAGKPFNVTLTAAGQTPSSPGCGVITEYTGNKNLRFWSTYNSPGTGSVPLLVNGSAAATSEAAAVDQTIVFSGGIATVPLAYSDAGSIKFDVKDQTGIGAPPAGTGSEIIGGVSPFVVRPFAFYLAPDGNPSATDGNGTRYRKAGQVFNTTIRPVLWESGDSATTNSDLANNGVTPNFANQGVQSLTLGYSLQSPLGGRSGNLSNWINQSVAFNNTATAGERQISNISWDDVGVLTMTASVANYMGSGISIDGSRSNVGRFYPDHFDVVANNGSFADACGIFSYIGQSFTYSTVPSLDITAKSAAGVTTQNYTAASYLKLQASDVVRSFPAADGSNGLPVTVTPLPGTLVTAATPGMMNYNFNSLDQFQYDQVASAMVVPFTSNLSVSTTALQDSDLVTASSLPSLTPTGSSIRYGRWNMENAFGPETVALGMTGQIEYLTSSGYAVNSADSCSVINSARITALIGGSSVGTPATGGINGITIGSGTTNFSYDSSLGMASGNGVFSLSAPGAGNTGSVDLRLDLSDQLWLRHDWDGNGSFEDHPDVTATFGQYRGHDRIIYWREMN